MGAANEQQRALYEKKHSVITEEVDRYDAEKNEIKKEAEAAADTNRLIAKKGTFFSASVVFFQIGIMLSSVRALLKKKFSWIIGLAFGAVAIVLLVYGLFLRPLLF